MMIMVKEKYQVFRIPNSLYIDLRSFCIELSLSKCLYLPLHLLECSEDPSKYLWKMQDPTDTLEVEALQSHHV